jgi:membrane-associated phospholipid phosphatase
MAKTSVTWIRLPNLITQKNKLFSFVIMVAISTFVYLLTNHHHRVPAVELPMTAFDAWVPFLPNTIFIYTSDYFLFLWAYLACRDTRETNKFAYAFMSLQFVSFFIFWAWPTTFPRHLFPLPPPDQMNALGYQIFSGLRSIESPDSCLPSLHVSCCYLAAFQFWHQERKWFPFFFTWATLVAISTLTVKQHYLVDIVGGLAMAMIFYWIFHHRVAYIDRPAHAKR